MIYQSEELLIKHAAHLPNFEKPALYTKMILEFLVE